MKAWILKQPATAGEDALTEARLEDPQPAPDEVRFRVLSCGVSRTDLPTVEGDLGLPSLPVTPGH